MWRCLLGSRRRGSRGVDVDNGRSSPSPRVGRRFAPQLGFAKSARDHSHLIPKSTKVRGGGPVVRARVSSAGAVRATSIASLFGLQTREARPWVKKCSRTACRDVVRTGRRLFLARFFLPLPKRARCGFLRMSSMGQPGEDRGNLPQSCPDCAVLIDDCRFLHSFPSV